MSLATGAVFGALALDLTLGEPPTRAHPVAWFGRVVARFDRAWSRPRAVGLVLAGLLPLLAALLVGTAVWLAGAVAWWAGLAIGALALWTVTSLRSLLTTVRRVSALSETDLAAARASLRALAGRDASTLDAGGVRSAALESLAENLADGLVAPLLAFTCGTALALGFGLGGAGTVALAAAAATWVKAVNTMDSMVGYRDRPLGFGAAKIDDAVMWLPARVTAVLLAVCFGAPRALQTATDWLDEVPSPNSGWPMGTLAAALGTRLEKPGEYVIHPTGERPSPAHVRRALRRVGIAGLSAYALAGVVAWY